MSARETDDSEWTSVEIALARALCIATGYDPDKHRNWRSFTDEVRPTISALKDAGYAVVPVKATPKMLQDAGTMEGYDEDYSASLAGADADHIAWWAAMLAAAQEEG